MDDHKLVRDGIRSQLYEEPDFEQKKRPAKSTSIPIALTQMEKEVLSLIFKVQANKEIAEELFISTRTVDAHKRNMLEKTGQV